MSSRHRFCAVEGLAAGDPLPGTATHARTNLLLSWPRRKWTRNLRHASDMPPELVVQLDQLASDGRRVNLIHRQDWPDDRHRLYLYPEGVAYDLSRDALPGFLKALTEGEDRSAWGGRVVDTPVILCCTHGKKDKCCARFGYATYRRLRQQADDQNLPVALWESSHLGGCRLAASLISFPSLRKYGRVNPAQVTGFLHHELAGKPYLPCYRGQGTLTPPRQSAEVAALGWLEERGKPVSWVVGPEREEAEGCVRVAVDWWDGGRAGRLDVTCCQQEVLRVDTCADLGAGPTPSAVWYAHRVEALPPVPGSA